MINKDTQLCISLAGRPGNFGTRFHNFLYQKLDLNYLYKAFTTDDIEHAVKGVRALKIRGCAVSMPFKESCMPFLDEISPSAQAISSVNTIVNQNGWLKAYNTDYLAITQLIAKYQLNPSACVIVHGSGGMAKAVVAAFRHSGFSCLNILARNAQSGSCLAALYNYNYLSSLDELTQEEKALPIILVNATPIGMYGGAEASQLAFPAHWIKQASVAFDVVALPAETPFIQYAKQLDKQTISGEEVIVLQAVEQFELYTGIRPNAELISEAATFARTGA